MGRADTEIQWLRWAASTFIECNSHQLTVTVRVHEMRVAVAITVPRGYADSPLPTGGSVDELSQYVHMPSVATSLFDHVDKRPPH
jgi:hypothetical protein